MKHPNLCSCDWWSRAVLIGCYYALWSVIGKQFQLVGMDANGDMVMQFWLDGAGLGPLVERWNQELPCSGRLSSRSTVQEADSSVYGFPLQYWVWDASVCSAHPTLVVGLDPLHHKESFSAEMCLFRVHDIIKLDHESCNQLQPSLI